METDEREENEEYLKNKDVGRGEGGGEEGEGGGGING